MNTDILLQAFSGAQALLMRSAEIKSMVLLVMDFVLLLISFIALVQKDKNAFVFTFIWALVSMIALPVAISALLVPKAAVVSSVLQILSF